MPTVAKPQFSDAFAAVLRRHREAAGLSQEALAEKASVHPTYVGLVERRQRNPSINVAHAFARALGIPLARLMKEVETSLQVEQRKR